jgi:DNA helicase INO80
LSYVLLLKLWQAEVRKKEEKEAIEMRKRLEEEREAKRQEQRLNFLIKQTELYSHFMQNKLSSQPSEDLPVGDENQDDQDVSPSSSDIETIEEEDSEEAELKKEALKAAQDAVSKQKKLTSAFDDECLRLREAAEPEAPQDVAGANNIDLHNPSVTWSFIVVNIVVLLDCTRKVGGKFFQSS